MSLKIQSKLNAGNKVENRSVKQPSSYVYAACTICLCLSVALLAGCASAPKFAGSSTPLVVDPVVSTPNPVAADDSLDRNEIIIDKPSALKSDTAGLMARISPAQQARIAQAVKDSNTDAKAQLLIVQASPKMRSFIERLSCIRQYNDGGTAALQALAAPGVSFKFFVPPMHGTKKHSKSTCLTITSVIIKPAITQVKAGVAGAQDALQIKVSYLAEDSGETTTSNHEINKNTKGVWWFTR